MKRISTVGLILLGIACSGAQAEDGEPNHQRQMDKLQTELKLSGQQKQEVSKIFEETRPQLEALHKQMQELRDKMRTRLKAVLTSEQMEKFDNLQQERREKRRRLGRDG